MSVEEIAHRENTNERNSESVAVDYAGAVNRERSKQIAGHMPDRRVWVAAIGESKPVQSATFYYSLCKGMCIRFSVLRSTDRKDNRRQYSQPAIRMSFVSSSANFSILA